MSGLKRYSKSAYEVRVQRLNESPGTFRIDSPESAYAYWREKIEICPWYDRERECCAVILLNTRHSTIGHSLVSLGSINESIVHAREVFRPAVALGAFGIVVGHNHPSGEPSPSEADLRLTRRLSEAGQLLQIPLIDHIIVGEVGPETYRPPYYSFKEAGVL